MEIAILAGAGVSSIEIPDAHLVERAVRASFQRVRVGQARWTGVVAALTVGSSVAIALCRRFDLDPYQTRERRGRAGVPK